MPVAIFVGKEDSLATTEDAAWTQSQLGDIVVRYQELDGKDHSAFNYGKDMSYLEDVIKVLFEFNSVPTYTEE